MRPAIIFEDGIAISRADLQTAVESFGGYLAGRIAPGDRVAIVSENRIEFMIAWLAVVANGAALVSINPTSRGHDAGHVLRDSAAVLAIVTEHTHAMIDGLRPQCPALRELVVMGPHEPAGLDAYRVGPALNLDHVSLDPQAPTNVYYTSGTTGPPKGCQLGNAYWIRFVDLWLRLYGLGPSDRLMCCVPFFYGDAPWQFLTSLHAGSTWVAMRRFSVSRFWDVVRDHRVTELFMLASMPSLLLKTPPGARDRDHSVRFAIQIGIPANLHGQMVERWGFPWAEGYGLTETGLVVAMPLTLADEMNGSGSIGVPCPEVQVRLLDGAGAEVLPGRPGEIVVRAPGMMQGYLNRPEASAEVLSDGWLRTGDLARADDQGFLYFLGRKKDIIRRSGENVSAAEVEQVLRAHPAVLEVAVTAEPDELRGEEIKAHVEPVPAANDERLAERLVEFCLERLARHKVPRYLEIRQTPLPRTPTMRVNKTLLRAEDPGLLATSWDRERQLGW